MSISNNDFSREFLLLLLLANNSIIGRKKFQKIVYVANLMGWNAFHDYRFYHFGPYSEDLFKEIENLQQLHLISVSMLKNNSYYEHNITEKGKRFLNILTHQNKDSDLVKRTGYLIEELNKYTSRELEAMSSFYFIKNEYPDLDNTSLLQKLIELKPHLADEISKSPVILNIIKKYNI